jgi:hypothetical protein
MRISFYMCRSKGAVRVVGQLRVGQTQTFKGWGAPTGGGGQVSRAKITTSRRMFKIFHAKLHAFIQMRVEIRARSQHSYSRLSPLPEVQYAIESVLLT